MHESVMQGQPIFQKEPDKEASDDRETVRGRDDEAVRRSAEQDLPVEGVSRDAGKSEEGRQEDLRLLATAKKAIEKDLGKTIPENSFTLGSIRYPGQRIALDLADKFFTKTIVYKSPEASGYGAFIISSDPSVLFINETTRKPHIVSVMHEAIHRMEQVNRDGYERIVRVMQGLRSR